MSRLFWRLHREAGSVDRNAGTYLNAINLVRWKRYLYTPEIISLFDIHNRSLALHNPCDSHIYLKCVPLALTDIALESVNANGMLGRAIEQRVLTCEQIAYLQISTLPT